MRRPLLVLALLGAGCPGRGGGSVVPPSDPYPGREQNVGGALTRDLEIEVYEGYQVPTYDTDAPGTAVSNRVGVVHIGVGPDDIAVDSPSGVDRWPLVPVDDLGERLDRVESKRLELHLARDFTAAWTFDELSYRVPGCLARDGTYKQVVIPLRLTSVFVRDGERWVPVMEHLSYPQRTAELVDHAGAKPLGKRMRNGRDPRPEASDPLQVVKHALDPALPPTDRAQVFATGDDALALWPDPNDELRRGAVVDGASLAAAFDAGKISLESWRVGMSPDPTGGVGGGSVAWVATTLLVDARRQRGDATETATLRLRATFVLERRDNRWQIVQSHVSSPVDDDALLGAVLGTGEVSAGETSPWQRPCEGEWTAPSPSTSQR